MGETGTVGAQAPGAPTLHDVAKAAGVSLATASRVVNGSERNVAETYRRRVQDAADRLGYTANLSAQAIAKGTSAVVALLVADVADPYFAQIAAGVVRAADEAGLVVTVSMTSRDAEKEARLIRALRGQRPRALVLAASRNRRGDGSARELQAFSDLGGRVVALGRGAPVGLQIPIDNVGGARALGRMMGDLGYRDAIVLAAPDGVLTSDDRLEGFASGFADGGGRVDRVFRGDFTREAGREAMERALSDGVPAGTLVFAISDVVAIGAQTALREAGRAIGADVALCGFDDIPAASDVTPGLTSVRVPLEAIGYAALQAATALPGAKVTADIPPLRVVVRGSTPRPLPPHTST